MCVCVCGVYGNVPLYLPCSCIQPLGSYSTPVQNARHEAAHMRQVSMSAASANYNEAARLKSLLKRSGDEGECEVRLGMK